jgi:hypothetical protein
VADRVPTPLRLFSVEEIRLQAEHDLLHRFSIPLDLERELASDGAARDWVARRAVRLTPHMAPELFSVAGQAQRVLGITKPLELYQIGEGGDNACVVGVGAVDRLVIQISGRVLMLLDRGTMRAILGHELGHHLAHPSRSRWGTGRVWLALERGRVDRDAALRYMMATELTADRVGLLVCQSLEDALRLEMIMTAGIPGSAISWDTAAFLDQCREQVDKMLDGTYRPHVATHPEQSIRGYALSLFSETDVYRAATGLGPGTRKIGEVDRRLATLLGVAPLNVAAPVSAASPASVPGETPGLLDSLRAGLRRAFGGEVPPPPPSDPIPSDEELFADPDEERLNREFAELERQLAQKGKK